MIRLGVHSVQFAHKNGKSRIICVRNAQFAHLFSYFIMVIIENRAYVLLSFT